MTALSILEAKRKELEAAHDLMIEKARGFGFVDENGDLTDAVLDVLRAPETEITRYKLDHRFPPISEEFYELGDAIKAFRSLAEEYEALKKKKHKKQTPGNFSGGHSCRSRHQVAVLFSIRKSS